MMSIVQILPNGGRSPNPQPRLVEARVSSLQPAPSSFTDPLFVVEDHDPDHAYRITNWPALHGTRKPAVNALVILSFVGDQRTPRVIYWDGVYA